MVTNTDSLNIRIANIMFVDDVDDDKNDDDDDDLGNCFRFSNELSSQTAETAFTSFFFVSTVGDRVGDIDGIECVSMSSSTNLLP